MANRRYDEYQCFRTGPFTSPVILFAGHLHTKNPKGFTWHRAPYYLFHYISDGKGELKCKGDRDYTAKAGDWFFSFPEQEFWYGPNDNDPWLYYWIAFQGTGVDTILARAGISPETRILSGSPDPVTENILKKILVTLDDRGLTSDLLANSLLLQLLIHLIETAPKKGKSAQHPKATSIDISVSQAKIFMLEYYSAGVDVNEVCMHVGYERTYFSKVFSRETGTTIREYMASLRLKKAQELLAKGELRISEIANITGFSESRTFTHFFKKQTGFSPKKWRESQNIINKPIGTHQDGST